MALVDQINDAIKAAMKAREQDKLAALRDIKSKLLLEATSGKDEVSEADEMKVINKLFKQRQESAKLYREQGRDDLAQDEEFQATIIKEYLPEMMGEDEIRKVVTAQIEKVGASGPSDIGKVMGPIMGQLQGKADGSLISKIVKEELNK